MASQSTQLLVSLEGLPYSCRDQLLKNVQGSLGGSAATTSPDPPATAACAVEPSFAHALGCLLQRVRALRRLTSFPIVLFTGTWLDKVPAHPVLAALYADLARELTATAALPGQRHRHLMVFLRTSPHEAFEAAVAAGAEGRDLSLRGLLALSARLEAMTSSCAVVRHPFPLTQIQLNSVPYASDHAPALAATADVILTLIAGAVADLKPRADIPSSISCGPS
jgi:hypothetical protein